MGDQEVARHVGVDSDRENAADCAQIDGIRRGSDGIECDVETNTLCRDTTPRGHMASEAR